MFDDEVRRKILNLGLRLSSSAIRIVAISLLFNFDGVFARNVLFILSSIYLFQIISGLEIYLDPMVSIKQHLAIIIHTGLMVLPLVFFYFWFYELGLLWVLFFLLDYVLVEISRKNNVSNKIAESNQIAIKRAFFFLLAVVFSFYYPEYFLPTLIACTLIEVVLQILRHQPTLKVVTKDIFKNLSFMAIALTVTNRSVDLAIRNINKNNGGFMYEYWDFFLSIFGLTATVTFYLFIASHAKDILKNKIRVPLRVYLVQPAIIFLSMLASLIYFWAIKGRVGLDTADIGVVIEIYCIAVIVSVFQVHNWNLLALRRVDLLDRGNMLAILATASIGLSCAFIYPSEYLLYFLMLILLIVTIFGIKKGASSV